MARGNWFAQSGWGVLTHYLAHGASAPGGDELTPEAWNKRVNSVEVARLVDQLTEAGASYYILTIGQNHGYYCTPNQTYERLTGQIPSRLAERDLVEEIAGALAPAGIRMMVYLPSHAPAYNREVVEALACTPNWDASRWQLRPGTYLRRRDIDDRLSLFQRHWEAIIREWSERWGDLVHGWWFDGCYYADRMYRHEAEPNFQSFAAAARAGNPDSIVAFNPGVKVPIVSHSDMEDYTAGEIAHTLPVGQWGPDGYEGLPARIGQAQYHLLTFMGMYWGRGEPRFTPAFVQEYTRYVVGHGGVLTWDVPITKDGQIPRLYIDYLKTLKR